uniref:Fe2OG dioxygenase domain-containing protein n=1 Tax=Alexandrium catenella TaxID=2925 RepID=A0A7S1SAI2_ALECA
MGTIRLLQYPGEQDPAAAEADVGIAPHTDFEAFTLMHQNAPGLQFLPAHYEASSSPSELPWVDAPVRDAEFVVILGDVLERFTNGVLRATPHRVLRTGTPRLSIIRFNAVAPDVVVEPMAAFVTEERPKAYTRCTMRQHMDTTMKNLELGLGSWDAGAGRSTSAHYHYAE